MILLKQNLKAALLLFGGVLSLNVQAFTVNVVDTEGTPVTGFRWLVEQDNTHPPEPGVHKPVVPGDPEQNTLSISLHKSHAPVVVSGYSTTASAVIDTLADNTTALPAGRYVVSILPDFRPDQTYTMGGANIDTAAQNAVTIVVTPNPIETAQIAIKVFEDNRPLNNAPDATEVGLANFRVELTDQAGDIIQDAFGNKLGTTYLQNCGPGGNEFCLDADGNPIVAQVGSGTYLTDANGEVIIKYLRPNKYGIQVKPPNNNAAGWYQTTTIEGTKTIDAWVRPKEPPFLVEFGPPFWHAFYGFVRKIQLPAPGGPATIISGQVRKGHQARPPEITFSNGAPPSTSPCLIGLNDSAGNAVFMDECGDDGFFQIPNVPAGTYQLVVFDTFLDHIIFFTTVITSDTGGVLDLGTLATPMWFAEHEHFVFNDTNENGFRDPGEIGIPEQNINLRFRDGTIYQAFPTDTQGFVPFEEVFPFFKWQIAEVDFARFKATGVTVVVDDGGEVTNDAFGEGKRNPQLQANGLPYRTETGPVLLEAYQSFAGQNLRFEWGKAQYSGNENGGISGIVFYATTRAEDDPRFAAGEGWEPGIPRVQVNLYTDLFDNNTGIPVFDSDGNPGDGIPDPAGAGATYPYQPVYADIDNYPLGWSEGGAKGPEDIDHNDDGVFDLGDAIRITHSDSWDDNLPTGCRGNNAAPLVIHGTQVPISDCAEGLRTWNQVRPGVFDGGWAFGEPAGEDPLPNGSYIVEAGLPPGYKHAKEEDRNVDFGNTPTPFLLPAACVGDVREVPPYFSFLTQGGDGQTLLAGFDPNDPGVQAPFAGDMRPLCNRKKVVLKAKQNAAADFFMFTDVPRAARVVGLITDDLANELAPGKPGFVEKFSPGWIPISVRDYSNQEILRIYSDEFGAYNALLPSTYNIDLPTPSGVGSQMHQLCLNDPGPIPDGNGGFVDDPRFRPQYSTTCYNFNFEPGRTTYLDTPIIRLAAFVGPLQSTLDCEPEHRSPVIQQVIGNTSFRGPYITGDGALFTIRSVGPVQVRNPDYPGDANNDGLPDDPPTQPEFITRNFGFGGQQGTIRVGDYVFPDSAIQSWANRAIRIAVPTGAVADGLATGQLMVTRANGQTTQVGVTLTLSDPGEMVVRVRAGESIQAAIDAANDGDLILVDPGVYPELVILYKKVKLQGAGAGSTVIDARHYSTGGVNAIDVWRQRIAQLTNAGLIGLLPGQEAVEPFPLFFSEEGPGIFVAPIQGRFQGGDRARVDGFAIRGGDLGGGMFVNAYANRLQITNNRFINNLGTFGGAIRIGNPTTGGVAGGAQVTIPSPNPGIDIQYNHILENGSQNYGGGITVYSGANNYDISQNNLCGNFSRTGGGGIGHQGLSNNGHITQNSILFNEVFQGDQIGGGGGGIEIAGEPDAAGGLTAGSGSVLINGNLIQGNLGGAADGGGIALRLVNGQDVAASPNDDTQWYLVRIFNNMLVNNVSGLAGGGISLQDAARVRIIHNTVANNDSSATALDAFTNGVAAPSTPQVAGIVSRVHSAGLLAALPDGSADYSVPQQLRKNIVWHNRSFYFDAAANGGTGGLLPNPAAVYTDFGVVGSATATQLDPRQSLLSETASGFHGSNILAADAGFVAPYLNNLVTAAAADEGGNFVQVLYTPLGLTGEYHLLASSPAINAAGTGFTGGQLAQDIDGDPRPSPANATGTEMGADEVCCDTLTVVRADYNTTNNRLIIVVRSTASPDASLTLRELGFQLELLPNGRYRANLVLVPGSTGTNSDETINIDSNAGGTVSATVTRIP